MKNLNLSFLAMIIFTMIYSCNSTNQTNNTDTTSGDSLNYESDTSITEPADTAASSSTAFALKAGAGGMMEVQLGLIAQQNARSLRVKSFGEMMMKDHTKANEELTALAESKNILIPAKLPVELQTHIDEMKKLKGADFDKHYMDMMTDDHKEDIDLFEKAVKNLDDMAFKSFASKTLPVLNMHLDSAKAIKADLK